MRKKYIIYAISLALIWVILVVKLKGLHYTWSRQSYRLKPPKIVEIGYFLRSYRLSIDEEPNNHHGEYGSAVEISEDEIEEKNSKFKIHQFNELASIKMPVLRKLPEKRRQSCFLRQYTFELPTASIIIIFHNEAFSTLIRTVHTAISRSPYHLVKEIILVDDFSDYEKFPSLLFPLEDHFKNTIKVKILRASERMGLTVSRLRGAKIAKGEVLVFLDSHCEAFDGWLEPLLYDIKKYPNFAITPIIETIRLHDFSIDPQEVIVSSVGTFDWNGDFDWYFADDQNSSSDLLRSPAMAGGLFAIKKDFFFQIGSYDDKMTYWGGENIEISFRLWMCGGGILQDFCSIVGHVFRDDSPIKIPENAVLYNKIRAIEVWMDDYKNIVYKRIGVEKYIPAAGNLESRLKLRQDLKCHSFEWYLKNITPHIRIPGPTTYIRNSYTNMCLDVAHNTESGKHVLVISCHNNGGNQKAFEVSKKGQIFYDGYCLDLSESRPGSKPTFYSCNSENNQQWIFTERSLVYHSVHNLCLIIHKNSKFLSTAICDITDLHQKFGFEYCD